MFSPSKGKKRILSLPEFMLPEKNKKKTKVHQIYTGLKVYGQYEAYTFLIVMMALIITVSVLFVNYFGRSKVKASKGVIIDSVPMSARSSLATVQYMDMSGTPRTSVMTIFPMGNVGDVVPLYVGADGNVYASKTSAPLNAFGVSVIIVAVVLSLFVLWKFFLIIKYPGLAVVKGWKS